MDCFYELDIAAIILSLVLFLVMFIRKSFPTLQRKLFKYALFFSLITSATEILAVMVWNNVFSPNLVWYNIICTLSSAVHFTFHFTFLLYILSLCRNDTLGKKAEKITFSIIFSVVLLYILTNSLHQTVFSFDDEFNYVYRFGSYIMTGFSILFSLYAVVVIFMEKRKLEKHQFVLSIVFFLSLLAAVLVENLCSYSVFVENFVVVITFSMLGIVFDNPNKYFVEGTTIYNETTFNLVYGKKIKNKTPFSIMAFAFNDFDLYIQKFGKKRANVAIVETLKNCRKRYGQTNVFLLGRNVVVIDAKSLDIAEETNHITISSYQGGIKHNPELKLNAKFAIIDYPNDVKNMSDLHDSIYMILFNGDYSTDSNVFYFNKSLLEKKHREQQIVMRLHDAIENDGFVMNYQPLFDWKENKFIALEALVRFKQNEGEEFISPAEFIPIAEEYGLIYVIDELIFEKVCRFIRNNEIKKYGIRFVDINLSLFKLLDSSTIDRYTELCSRYEIDPSFINLEITETAEGDDKYLQVVRANIARFREHGFNFSLDDYGSGYSTVIYMAEMDTKIVKIDASILWNAMKNKKYYTVLENCVRLVYCFDKECVVEGVETEEMVDVLKRLGVDYFQGYYYSKPLPETEIIKFLESK